MTSNATFYCNVYVNEKTFLSSWTLRNEVVGTSKHNHPASREVESFSPQKRQGKPWKKDDKVSLLPAAVSGNG